MVAQDLVRRRFSFTSALSCANRVLPGAAPLPYVLQKCLVLKVGHLRLCGQRGRPLAPFGGLLFQRVGDTQHLFACLLEIIVAFSVPMAIASSTSIRFRCVSFASVADGVAP